MRRAPPEFWSRPGPLPLLLAPLGWGYGLAGTWLRAAARPWRAPVPVICVGNLVAGGAGKTPVARDLAIRLKQSGTTPHILTRGYGGSVAGPLAVDPSRHTAHETGDEALLLAAAAPVWVARDRAAGARAAIAAGARILVLDDGLQNRSLAQDLKLLVVDGTYGFGNGRVMPAGPLREPAAAGIARADAIVIMGEDRAGIAARLRGKPVLSATLRPRAGAPDLAGRSLVAFAGIGRPEKFFSFLTSLGATLIARHAFPDHQPYDAAMLAPILAEAARLGAPAVTTEKDLMRVPAGLRDSVVMLPVEVQWHDPTAIAALLARIQSQGGAGG